MKRSFLLLFPSFMAALGISPLQAADALQINVRIISPSPPAEVTIQREDQTQTRSMMRDASSQGFRIDLPSNELGLGNNAIKVPFTVVGTWQDSSEQLYLQLPHKMHGDLGLEIFHDAISDKREMLDTIESRGPDLKSELRKYFEARAYHKAWRYKNRQPEHQVAIRSAKIWFDAAYNLTTRPNSIYAMDQEAVKIMANYEARAKTDSGFARRYRMHARAGYVEAMMAQLAVLDFQIAGQIPAMIQAGNLAEAEALNSRLISRLEQLPRPMQAQVERLQRLNASVLHDNAKFIASRSAAVQSGIGSKAESQ